MGIFDRYFDRGDKPASSSSTPSGVELPDAISMVRAYHAATKHHPQRYARGPQALDWETQPDPFRRYAGAPELPLLLAEASDSPRWDLITQEGGARTQPLNQPSLSKLLQFSLGLSAWKQYGDSRWSLRMNPSSGNLHPTEAYVLAGPIQGWREEGFIAHYAPREHCLEVRANLPSATWDEFTKDHPEDVFFVGLTSILWREEWKYGERAYRYCQHDVGHAIAAIAYSASCLGWKVRVVDSISSEDLAHLLGLRSFGEAEPEEPDTLLAIYPGEAGDGPELPMETRALWSELKWIGTPNQLSSEHLVWDAIHACAVAAEKPTTAPAPARVRPQVAALTGRPGLAYELIAQRRSAVAMDGQTTMDLPSFLGMLERCLASREQVPFESFPWTPRVHLLLFVHRVEGLEPGVYLLLREEESGRRLLDGLGASAPAQRVSEAPEDLALYRLAQGSCQSMAASLSCGQDIAGLGTFSTGMLAEFDATLEERGAWFYPRLFWETGMIGQTLYLEAEAAGLRGTGIGCFHDDPVHQFAGLKGTAFQSLYHFTMGGPVEDERIQGHPPYAPS